ncbi:hypothetical protein [Nocardia sp. NPDC050717]|uniref:hypothetical protein n=1 Tax=Nocardia sp. NPDC050717 TaxID=3157221 RepID=UPI0033E3C3C7
MFAGALLRLDDAFASVASPASIAACPCCPEPADYAALLRTPRHQLTGIELGSFAFRVMNTVCSAAELRYFAGRILQLVHGGDQRMPDMEVVYGKLRRADWQSWAQAAALAEVFDALWDSMFAAAAPRTGVDTVLCALGAAEPSIAGRLVAWERLDSARSIRNLHEFVVRGCRRRGGGLVPRNSYWDRRWATYGELVAWLGRLPAAVNSAFDRVDDAESLELLAATHDVLEGARPSAAE